MKEQSRTQLTIPTPLRFRATGRHRDRGQSIVEAAMVLPVLLLLLVVVVDASRAFDAYIVLTNAAREGARFATLANPLTESEIKDIVVQDVLGSGTNITNMANFTETNVTLIPGSEVVTVTVAYDFPLWFGGLVGIDEFRLRKSAIMARALY
jgi:Flp pilus assembly protein TadG